LNCSPSTVLKWGVKFNWYERAREYDLWRDQQAQEEIVRQRLAMRQRQVRQGVAMQSVAAHALSQLMDRIKSGLLVHLEPHELSRLMEVGAKMERVALGEGRENRPLRIEVEFFIDDGEEQRLSH
jgi:hypothetical protein